MDMTIAPLGLFSRNRTVVQWHNTKCHYILPVSFSSCFCVTILLVDSLDLDVLDKVDLEEFSSSFDAPSLDVSLIVDLSTVS